MAIDELTELIAPPESPIDAGDESSWNAAEDKLATKLPIDYQELCRTYGSGKFGDIELCIANPNTPEGVQWILDECVLLETWREYEGGVPYSVYPASPGLLPIGSDANGNQLLYLTSDSLNDWQVVVRAHDSEPEHAFQEFPVSLTSFLARAFLRKLDVSEWTAAGAFASPDSLSFKPNAIVEDPSMDAWTLYHWYEKNGNRADFWVRDINSRPETADHVKAIDGQTAGKLNNPFGRLPSATIASYVNGQLFNDNVEVSTASRYEWLLIEPQVVSAKETSFKRKPWWKFWQT